MKVFISWSGDTSKAVAKALADWIPLVINAVEPFMSDGSIEPGQRWQTEIATQLEDTAFGLVCVTRDNQTCPWLNFESGALAKKIDESRLVPVVYDLELGEVELPIGQFNGVRLDFNGITRLMRSIHVATKSNVKSDAFERALAKWWPDLNEATESIATPIARAAPVRTERELLLEILDTVRGLSREIGSAPQGWPWRDFEQQAANVVRFGGDPTNGARSFLPTEKVAEDALGLLEWLRHNADKARTIAKPVDKEGAMYENGPPIASTTFEDDQPKD